MSCDKSKDEVAFNAKRMREVCTTYVQDHIERAIRTKATEGGDSCFFSDVHSARSFDYLLPLGFTVEVKEPVGGRGNPWVTVKW